MRLGRASGLLYASAGGDGLAADEELSGLTVGVTKHGLHLRDSLLHPGQGRVAPHGVEGVANVHFGLRCGALAASASTRCSQEAWHESSLEVSVQHCPDVFGSGEGVNGTNDNDPQSAQKLRKTFLLWI